jgi:DNA-binding response OmpR family regulator
MTNVKFGEIWLRKCGKRDQKSRLCEIREKGFDFLQKPFGTEALLARVREALDSTGE